MDKPPVCQEFIHRILQSRHSLFQRYDIRVFAVGFLGDSIGRSRGVGDYPSQLIVFMPRGHIFEKNTPPDYGEEYFVR